MSKNMDVTDMVVKYLKENGHDGLVSEDNECGCLLDDLAPCGEVKGDCVAGKKVECNEDCGHPDEGGDRWHVEEGKHVKIENLEELKNNISNMVALSQESKVLMDVPSGIYEMNLDEFINALEIEDYKSAQIAVKIIKELKEKLEFYANSYTWVSNSGKVGINPIDRDTENIPTNRCTHRWCGGIKAREAFKNIKVMLNNNIEDVEPSDVKKNDDKFAYNLWISKCARRFLERSDLKEDVALDFAKINADVQLREFGEDIKSWESPEYAADEDMNNWDKD